LGGAPSRRTPCEAHLSGNGGRSRRGGRKPHLNAQGCMVDLEGIEKGYEGEGDCCVICFEPFAGNEPAASQANSEGRGILFDCQHAGLFHVACLQREAQQNRPFHCPLCRVKFKFSRTCICGAELEEHRARDRKLGYGGGGVLCDHCFQEVPKYQRVYHCPMGKCDIHPAGYDVCRSCAGQSTKKKRPRRRSRARQGQRVDAAAAANEGRGQAETSASPVSQLFARYRYGFLARHMNTSTLEEQLQPRRRAAFATHQGRTNRTAPSSGASRGRSPSVGAHPSRGVGGVSTARSGSAPSGGTRRSMGSAANDEAPTRAQSSRTSL